VDRYGFTSHGAITDVLLSGNSFSGNDDSLLVHIWGSIGETITFIDNTFDGGEEGIDTASPAIILDCEFIDLERGLQFASPDTAGSEIHDTSFEDCGNAIIANDTVILLEGCTFDTNDVEMEITENLGGDWKNSTAIGMTINPGKVTITGNAALIEQNYIDLTVIDKDSTPIRGADVFIRNLDAGGNETEVFYATSYYGGSNETTPTSGEIGPLAVTYREHEEAGYREFKCAVNASYEGAEDSAELVMSQERSVTISLEATAPENRKPAVTITFPSDGGTVSGTIIIRGTASDMDGDETLEKIEIRIPEAIENNGWRTAFGSTEWEYRFVTETKDTPDGIYRVDARAYDGADNSDLDSIYITIDNFDNTPPEIETLELDRKKVEQGKNLMLTGLLRDEDGEEDFEGENSNIFIEVWLRDEDIMVQNLTTFPVVVDYGEPDDYMEFSLDFEADRNWKGDYFIRVNITDREGAMASKEVFFKVTEKKDDDDQMIEGIEDDVLIYSLSSVAILAAAVILGFYFMRSRKQEGEEAEEAVCPGCGQSADYIDEYESYYCWTCEDYV